MHRPGGVKTSPRSPANTSVGALCPGEGAQGEGQGPSLSATAPGRAESGPTRPPNVLPSAPLGYHPCPSTFQPAC